MTDNLVSLAASAALRAGVNHTVVEGLRVYRSDGDQHGLSILYRPGACFVLQGTKQAAFGSDVISYDRNHYLATSIPVPFKVEVKVDSDAPMYALCLDFDLDLFSKLAAKMFGTALPSVESGSRGFATLPMDAAIEDILGRLLKALQDETDARVLGPSIVMEMHYALLKSPFAPSIFASISHLGPAARIVSCVRFIHEHLQSSWSVACLAERAGMSIPSFHQHFRAVMGTSPLQYVKTVQLHEARRLILFESRQVSEAATLAGYTSASQFSREYKRYFGETPSSVRSGAFHAM